MRIVVGTDARGGGAGRVVCGAARGDVEPLRRAAVKELIDINPDGCTVRDVASFEEGCESLCVAGRSAFSSYSAHQPTLTICASALGRGRQFLTSS